MTYRNMKIVPMETPSIKPFHEELAETTAQAIAARERETAEADIEPFVYTVLGACRSAARSGEHKTLVLTTDWPKGTARRVAARLKALKLTVFVSASAVHVEWTMPRKQPWYRRWLVAIFA